MLAGRQQEIHAEFQTSGLATNENATRKYRAVDRRYRIRFASGYCIGILTGVPETQAAVT
jgi:hypothetical protein